MMQAVTHALWAGGRVVLIVPAFALWEKKLARKTVCARTGSSQSRLSMGDGPAYFVHEVCPFVAVCVVG